MEKLGASRKFNYFGAFENSSYPISRTGWSFAISGLLREFIRWFSRCCEKKEGKKEKRRRGGKKNRGGEKVEKIKNIVGCNT